jgi:hypothetical protein
MEIERERPPTDSRCIVIIPEPVCLGQFWEDIKLTRGVKSAILPAGEITLIIDCPPKMYKFSHSSETKWTLGMVLKKIYENSTLLGKIDAIHSKQNPNGSDFYKDKKIMKLNISAMKIYVGFI